MAGYDEDRSRSLAGPTELRIHGVGGSRPESLLRGDPVLVAGTSTSGFYRLRRPSTPRDERLEAYSWGGLTSGGTFLEALRKALWVILLPFTLMNAAGWMMPTPKGGGWRHGLGQRLLRIVAMFATMAFALALAAISVDLIGLQCGGTEECAAGQSWLRWLNQGRFRFVQGRPAALMALALIVPMAALAVIWFITRNSQEASEGRTDALYPEDEVDVQRWRDSDEMNIARPDLWGSAPRVLGLTRIHFGAAIAGVAAAYAATVVWLGNETGQWVLFSALLCVYAIGIVGWGVWLLRRGGTPPDRPTWWLLRLGILALLAAVLFGWLEGPTWDEAAGIATAVDIRTAFNWYALALALPLTAIIVVSGIALAGRRWRQAYFMPWTATFLGLIVGVAILAALALWVATWVDRRENTLPLDVWPAYEASVVVVLVLAVIIGVLTLWHLAVLWLRCRLQRHRHCLERIDDDYFADLVRLGEDPARRDEFRRVPAAEQSWLRSHKSWLCSLLRIMRISQLTVKRVIGVTRVVVVAALVAWIWALVDIVLVIFTDTSAGFASVLPAWSWPVTAGRWLAALLLATAVGLITRAYRNEDDRRSIGRLWDVLTFWPRWFHPIVPPSYAATAVPQLRDHLADRHTDRPVVLAAHSQGSVLALATAARLEPGTRAKVALLTFGSPALRLYGRFFHAWFGLPQLEKAHALLGGEDAVRWRNLSRCSDPIGGVVLTEDEPCPPRPGDPCLPSPPGDDVLANLARRLNEVDRLVPDPYPFWPPSGDPLPGPKGHSHYDLDRPYPDAVDELFGLLGVPPP